MSFAKLPAILLLGIGVHVSARPPNPTIAIAERKFRDGPIDVRLWILIFEVGYWVHALIEVVIILGAHWCPESSRYKQFVEYLLPHGQISLSAATVVAAVLGATAGAIRYQSFRELGRHFTYHVTILKEHKLVTTGPYSLVRHPGYMGWSLLYPAMAMYYMAPGSWFRETGMYVRMEGWLFILPLLITSISLLELAVRRSNAEDELLKKEFGQEWEEWADRVRYKLVPGLY